MSVVLYTQKTAHFTPHLFPITAYDMCLGTYLVYGLGYFFFTKTVLSRLRVVVVVWFEQGKLGCLFFAILGVVGGSATIIYTPTKCTGKKPE